MAFQDIYTQFGGRTFQNIVFILRRNCNLSYGLNTFSGKYEKAAKKKQSISSSESFCLKLAL